ncbi:MAG TPA: ATP-binding protein [Polyangia bacterium]|nr:ATP-binding protein [Polyangia bacterium]
MTSEPRIAELRVLLLAPSGRDAILAAESMERAGLSVLVCRDSAQLLFEVGQAAGAVVIAEEAITRAVLDHLKEHLGRQPPWSDLPLIIFTARSASASQHRRALETFAPLGNVTILERPIHPSTLVSAVSAALRGRDRQYAAREAIRRQEEEVRQRDQFLAMLGHELRNPLGALRTATELVNRRATALPALDRPLSIMNRQVNHLARLVDDLLDVARVTSGKIAIRADRLDVAQIVARLVEETARQASEKQLKLQLELPPGPAFVLGDAVRLEQILQNLIGNAIKYTPAGGTIVVSIEADDPVTITVADTGVGLGQDVLPTIFEPFVQVASTIDRSQGGMGLGLSVARALARLHRGDISVASPGLGLGSTFTVTLPRMPQGETTDAPAVARVEASQSRTVLLVEDGEDNREALAMLLELFGHKVHTAADGQEGIDRALQVRPEIALVDIGLPKVDGYEVARRLRAKLGARISLIALSGYGQPEDQARAMESGFDTHLTKPVDAEVLRRTLAQPPHRGVN